MSVQVRDRSGFKSPRGLAKYFTEKSENEKSMEIFTFESFLPDQVQSSLELRVSE